MDGRLILKPQIAKPHKLEKESRPELAESVLEYFDADQTESAPFSQANPYKH